VSDRVVARLAYPMRVEALGRLVKALEKTYGKGLVIVTGGEDWAPGHMTIARPEPVATEPSA
jgi:hypothetical protein